LTGEDRALSADYEEVYRVSSFDGDVWETFGEIAGTAFDANGSLYIFDRQASRITVVDPDGNFVREFRGPGEGPGELRMALGFTVMRDGTTVVLDLGHQAY
jgi:sugar lactone lactonase YvrE